MADINRGGSSKVRHFCYANSFPKVLTDPASISCYVYDPTNTVVYSDNKPLRDPDFNIGVFDFFIPAYAFEQVTKPETYFTITTLAQMADGTMVPSSEQIQVS